MQRMVKEPPKFNRLPRPPNLFPLIRQVSYRFSPVLSRLGLSPNQLTIIGLLAGIGSALAFAQGTHTWGLIGAFLWFFCSLMDYCDGEVARITDKSSRFGKYLDDVTDGIVHTAFFIGLGAGAKVITGDNLWFWLGLTAAAGTIFNSLMNWLREWFRHRRGEIEPHVPGESKLPINTKEQLIYVFRGLCRADFWLLVILLELFHATWLMLPVFAIGVQIYWLAGFIHGADKFIP